MPIKTYTLMLLLTFLMSCTGSNPVPPEEEVPAPLITETFALPALGEASVTLDWEALMLPTPWGDLAANEVIYPDVNLYSNTQCIEVYAALYNWNQGKNVNPREKMCLDRSETYLMVKFTGGIKIVAYLIRHVWMPVYSFFSGLA